MDKIRIGVVGGAGYVGAELLRLLFSHPMAEVACAVSRSQDGKKIADVLPSCEAAGGLEFCAYDESRLAECAAVFLAMPHGESMPIAPQLADKGVAVIDLGADFRLHSADDWKKHYGKSHAAAAWLDRSAYGLTEANRAQIKKAKIIACPGCYATAILLGLIPLIQGGAIKNHGIIADAKSGVSGAGKKSGRDDLLFADMFGNFKAYSIGGHRHEAEMIQSLAEFCGANSQMIFIPHLLPTARGIYATLYCPAEKNSADARELAASHYKDEPFVKILPDGIAPELADAVGTNECRIGIFSREDSIVVLVALDNLLKGAAGQAVQNFNLKFGLDETLGLAAGKILR